MNKKPLVKAITGIVLATAAVGFYSSIADAGDLEDRVSATLSELTLEEKVSLTSGRDIWGTQPIERLGVPSMWLADGPHGLRRAPSTNHWGYGDQAPATSFPTSSALAASWDLDLVERVGQALGQESNALGVNVLLGPGVNVKRSVLGGRNFEYFSEDPILSGLVGAAYINGVQSTGVGTSLKHFVANNVETQRMWANSVLDDRTLNEIYYTPFEIAIKEAQPWTVMAAYNRVNGEYATESTKLLTDTLKNEWGFEGIVVSDWESVVDRIEGIRAGMHVEMPGREVKITNQMVLEAVESGELAEADLDSVVSDILRVAIRSGDVRNPDMDQNIEAHHELARLVASETITLLKNDHGLFPLDAAEPQRIAIIGEFAANPRYQGNGSSEVKPTQVDKLLDILAQEYGDVEVSYARGYNLEDDRDTSFIDEAVAIATEADVAILLAGLPLSYESEGIDRTHIDLPPAHNELIARVAAAQRNSAVMLVNGSAVAMPWINDVGTVVETWLAGQAGAGAMADVMFGKVNPSGKLAETFPVRLGDTPSYLNFPGEFGDVLYGERIYVGYRYYDTRDIEPLFPFGHGLSYTTFEYGDVILGEVSIETQEILTVEVDVTNTGDRKGKEVVQLYLSDLESSVGRPVQELKAFDKIELAPGETKTVRFELDTRDLSFYDDYYDRWLAESGDFEVRVGSSSRDIRSKAEFNYQSTEEILNAYTEFTFFSKGWADPKVRPLLIELMPNFIAANTPEGKTPEEAEVNPFIADQPMTKFRYFTEGEVTDERLAAFIEQVNTLSFTP